jgi:GT2 family glycosyltransferase
VKAEVTYIVTPITDVYISRFVYTLYKYSPKGSFNLIVVDQTENGFRPEILDYLKGRIHLYLHPHRNLGYAKAMNEGLLHALHWKTPYICCSNDDIEIMDPRWIQGIYDTFAMNERIMGVVPMNPRVPGWGYGVKHNPELLPYKKEYTPEDYDYLLGGDFTDQKDNLPKTFPTVMTGNIVDGAIFIMPYFKRELFEKVGLMDEHFFPGSGEDMDMMGRAYKEGYRIVSTSKSWVWHHLSKSKDLFASGTLERPYYKNRPYWNEMGLLWPPEQNENHHFDPWGHYTNEKGEKTPLKRISEIFVDDIQ